jgi:ribonuclease HI
MYFDGSRQLGGTIAGMVLISLQGDNMRYVLRMGLPNASSNDVEYEALLHGMHMAKACGATRPKMFGDLNLAAH